MNNKKKGSFGEKKAHDFLKNKGYTILQTNYRNRFGEIDLICSNGNTIIFVEVKYRNNINNGHPVEAVNKKKQDKIKNMALTYISENQLNKNDFRFDVIGILNENIEHIENAF